MARICGVPSSSGDGSTAAAAAFFLPFVPSSAGCRLSASPDRMASASRPISAAVDHPGEIRFADDLAQVLQAPALVPLRERRAHDVATQADGDHRPAIPLERVRADLLATGAVAGHFDGAAEDVGDLARRHVLLGDDEQLVRHLLPSGRPMPPRGAGGIPRSRAGCRSS
jgi:hypothetical protein